MVGKPETRLVARFQVADKSRLLQVGFDLFPCEIPDQTALETLHRHCHDTAKHAQCRRGDQPGILEERV
jgi:hypothetical protein